MLKLISAFDMDYQSVLNYYNTFINMGYNDFNCYAISLVGLGEDKYFNWIYEYGSNIFYLVDSMDENDIIGYGSINDYKILNCHTWYNIGNIGYGIRPDLRKQGYGNKILKLMLEKCEEIGMSEVCVSCKKGNYASQKIILNNNGKFEKEFYDDFEGSGLKYWIKLNPKVINRVRRLINRTFKDN